MIEIRRAKTDEDIKNIADLADIIWHEHFIPIIGIEQVEYMLEKFQSYNALKKAVDKDGYVYFMAYDNDVFCGYSGIKPEEDNVIFISKVYVESSHRKKGIASKLIDAIKSAYPEYKKLWLTVNRHNTEPVSVYKRMGFCVTREQAADIGGGFVMDDYIMEYVRNRGDAVENI